MSRWLFNISMDGDSTTSLGKLCQCTVLIVKKVLPEVQREPPAFLFVPFAAPVLWLGTTEKNLALLLHPLQVYWGDLLWAFSSPDATVPSLSQFPHRREMKTAKKWKIFEKGKKFLLSSRFKWVSQTEKKYWQKLTDKLKIFWKISCKTLPWLQTLTYLQSRATSFVDSKTKGFETANETRWIKLSSTVSYQSTLSVLCFTLTHFN